MRKRNLTPNQKSSTQNLFFSHGRPPGFSYRVLNRRNVHSHPTLHCDRVAVPHLADKYGTPLYIYSASVIAERARALDQAFGHVSHTLCYSVKANSTLAILRLFADLGCGFDVVSGGELERVMRISRRAASSVVFSGVGKTAEEMDAALKAGILLFNVESESEVEALAGRAARLKKIARVSLRVNPDVPAKTHPYISTGLHKHKFGVPMSQARRLYAFVAQSKFLDPAGVSVHIGSQITSMQPFAAAMERVAEMVRQLKSDGHAIRYVDAGGGLGIAYDQSVLPDFGEYVRQYAHAITHPLRSLKIHLLLEPGRAIVGPAGILITRVLYRKTNGSKRFLVVDAAMNDLLRPALYDAYHEIVPAVQNRRPSRKFDVVGPVCETGDFFARDRVLPVANEGDLLAILDVGAYGIVLASNYNSRPRPAEVLVDGDSTRLIKRRETISDLLRLEK